MNSEKTAANFDLKRLNTTRVNAILSSADKKITMQSFNSYNYIARNHHLYLAQNAECSHAFCLWVMWRSGFTETISASLLGDLIVLKCSHKRLLESDSMEKQRTPASRRLSLKYCSRRTDSWPGKWKNRF